MMINQSPLDRALRMAIGLALLLSPLIGFATIPYNWLGLVPIATAILGYCPLYALFGTSSCSSDSYQYLKNVIVKRRPHRTAAGGLHQEHGAH